MHEAGDGRVAVLGQRVLHHRREGLLLATQRHDLAADGVGRVARVDEAQEVGRDVDAELVRRAEALALLVGQLEDACEGLEVVDTVGELPAPVIPLLVRDVRIEGRAAAARRAARQVRGRGPGRAG